MSVNLGNYKFNGPFKNMADLDNRSGVYAVGIMGTILTGWKIIDIGESKTIRDRIENHDRKDQWRSHTLTGFEYATYYCDEADRVRIESELRKQYNPPCGKR